MATEAPPAPAAAPAATPAPAAPSPNAAPAAKGAVPVSKPAENMADAYGQLDAMAGLDANPGDKPQDDPGDEPAPEAGKKAPEKTETTQPDKGKQAPVKAGTLRENYDRLKKDYEGLQTKLKTLETERAKPADDPEKKTLSETLQQRDKRLQELEEEMRYTNYERSSEYKEKYWAPFANAYTQGRQKTASLKAVDGEGNLRAGTEDDFDAIMKLNDDDAAADMAAELFGVKAPLILYHRERVNEANQARLTALEDYRKKGSEREKQRSEGMEKQRKELAGMWDAEVKAGIEKFPQWFKPVDGDEKGNELLTRGTELADIAFGIPVTDPKTGQPVRLSQQEMVKLHSAVRNKAAGFDRLAFQFKQSQGRIKELEKQLKEYEASEPGPGDGKGGKSAGGGGSAIDQAADSLSKYMQR